MPSKGSLFTANKETFTRTVPRAWFAIIVFNMGAVMFGFDTAMFGALQVTPSWLGSFGERNAKGKYVLSAIHTSLLNSIPWFGKLIGVLIAEPINDRFGYKFSLLVACCLQAVGVIIEMIGLHWGVFLAGRTVVYGAVGYVENVVPLYIGEIVYPQSRGFFIALYSMILAAAQIWANGVIQAISSDTTSKGWRIICGQQFIPIVLIVAGIKWCPSSPRWLLQKGKREAAFKSLASVRTAEDDRNGWVEMEIVAIEEAIHQEKLMRANSWLDLFRGTNLRRTWIGVACFIANQWTGNQFVGSYAPTLYVQLGLQKQAFLFTLIKSILSMAGVLASMIVVDRFGRRFVMIVGCVFQAIFLYILAGMGMSADPSDAQLRVMVASLQLFIFFARASTNAMAFLIAAEVSNLTLRKKTMAIACAVDVLAAFVVTFATPYLIKPTEANLGSKVGFIFGGFTTIFLIWTIFCLPELKGRSLEEVDELFSAKLWAWQFSSYQTQSLGGRVAAHTQSDGEAAGKSGVGLEMDHVEGQEGVEAVDIDRKA